MIKKIITFIIIIAVILMAVKLVKKRKESIENAPTAKVMLTSVKAYRPTQKELSSKESYLASLQALNQLTVSSKTTGYIKKIYVKEAQYVKTGDLLAEIDNVDIITSIESLKSNLTSAKENLSLAYKSLKRAKALYDIGGISKESYEIAQASLSAKKSQVTTIQNSIKAKQNLLTYSKILSPIDGKIGVIFTKEGSLSAPAKPIMEIIGDKKRLLFSYTPDTAIKVGQKVIIDSFEESITSIYPNTKNSLATAEILLTHELNLPIGSNVDIDIVFETKKGLAVPINALLHDDGISVMVFRDKHFEKQKVKIEVSDDEFAIISPMIKEPVAIGSEAKLSILPSLKDIKVVFDETK